MEVAIAGGHGKVALRLERLLAERGDRARGLIRNPDHARELEEAGAEPVRFDLEAEGADELAEAIADADAVVFAAGAGPGSGPERKRTVDYGGAVKLIAAAKQAGITRYVMVSAINADRPESWSERMRPYHEAKRDADSALARSGLDHTVVRPGMLTDHPGTGRIAAGPQLERGQIPRDDVAATLVAVLDEPGTIGLDFDLVGGSTPIEDEIRQLAADRP